MTSQEFLAHVKERLAHHEYVCGLAGHEVHEGDSCMTLLHAKRSAPIIGVRGVCIGSTFDQAKNPMWYFSYTVKQCRKLAKILEKA